jgi:hypothetical protein
VTHPTSINTVYYSFFKSSANGEWDQGREMQQSYSSGEWALLQPRISGSANPHCDFVIACQGEMASFPAGTTPFFLEIESARGVPCKKSPACSMTQLTSSTRTLCRSAIPWLQLTLHIIVSLLRIHVTSWAAQPTWTRSVGVQPTVKCEPVVNLCLFARQLEIPMQS